MLLRSISKHVDDQNWAAIGIDFLIVVMGVFIGIQLGNWNEVRQVRSDLQDAQSRLVLENQANLDLTDAYISTIEKNMAIVQTSISHFKTCDTTATLRADLENGANAIRGTATLRLRKTALVAVTENNQFLSLLDEEERERLKELNRSLSQTQSTLDWLEERPFTEHIEDVPFIDYSDPVVLSTATGTKVRPLYIDAPLTEVCEDKGFQRAFYLWERTATFQRLRALQAQDLLKENIEKMEAQ